MARGPDPEEELLRTTALETSKSIIGARQRAERELRQAKAALEAKTAELENSLAVMRATLESTNDGILVVNQAGEVTHFNEQFATMWNIPVEVLRSTDRAHLLVAAAKQLKDPESFIRKTEEVYASAEATTSDLVELADGRVFERCSKIQRVHERAVGRVWSYRDLTDRIRAQEAAQQEIAHRKESEAERERLLISEKQARERAEREMRMKDEFLATLSHELRTPLNAILGWANLLRITESPEEIAEGLEVIERNARSQTQIIDDLLDMSRIISGNVRLDVQRVDLVPVIKAAVESLKPTSAAKEIRLTTVLDPLGGPISGDPARLQQIMWNLLTNALKFTPKGGRIQVCLERVNSHVEISVTDSGQGITPEFLPHVFDRFRQADASTTRKQRGLGLGLSIVKNLAELHGGNVRAKSPGLDQGSTFTVSFPIASAKVTDDPDRRHPQGAPGDSSVQEDPSLKGVVVLAVDDELDARQLITRLLSACGATVKTADSAKTALQLLQTLKPDVLITDIGMPDEDGYTLIRKVRELGDDNGGNVPAIALTAFARSEDRRRAILTGFQMHIAKPVEPPELIAMVASLARRAR